MYGARRYLPALALLALALAPAPAGAAEDAQVIVTDNYYIPESVTVEAGATVVWKQQGNLPHSVTAEDGSFDSHPACPTLPGQCMEDGDTYTRTFSQPGTILYYCKLHASPGSRSGMVGEVRVADENGIVPTTVTSLAATPGAGTVSVSGTATLGGEAPVALGQDGLGDAVGGPAATALGLDMDKLLISRPTASSSSLLFTIKLGGLATGGIPETILYNWDINVDGGATGSGASWSIKTMRTRASSTGGADPYAGVFTCVPSGTGFSCTQTTRLTEVVYDQAKNEIRMTIPLAAIGAKAGSRIEAWPRSTNAFWIGPTAAGAQTITNVFDTGTHDEYVVPAPTVHLGMAPAGQPVTYSTTGTVDSEGAFSGTLPAPASPGTYDVGAQVCFGTNCGTSSTQITI